MRQLYTLCTCYKNSTAKHQAQWTNDCHCNWSILTIIVHQPWCLFLSYTAIRVSQISCMCMFKLVQDSSSRQEFWLVGIIIAKAKYLLLSGDHINGIQLANCKRSILASWKIISSMHLWSFLKMQSTIIVNFDCIWQLKGYAKKWSRQKLFLHRSKQSVIDIIVSKLRMHGYQRPTMYYG